MSLLDRLRPDVADTSRSRGPSPVGWLSAALTGAGAAALSLLGVVVVVLGAWAASSRTTSTWGEGVRVATQGWLLLHHVELRLPGGGLSLAPLGLSLLPGAACWYAGRRVAQGHPDDDLVPGVRRGGAPPLRSLPVPLLAMAAGYAIVTVVAAALATGGGVRPSLSQALVLGLLLPAVVGTVAAVRVERRWPASALADLLRLPDRVRRAVRPAVTVVAGMVGLGGLAVTASLVAHHEEVLALHRALAPGAVGGAVLTLGQLGYLPDLVLWAVSWIAGPGFAVGVGSSVTPAGSVLGVLPLVPVLGAVPPPGPMPTALGAVVALPVLLGAVAGWLSARRRSGATAMDVVADALTAAGLAAAALTLGLAVSGGSAGTGLLTAVGPSAWQVGLVLAGELALGAGAGALATHRLAGRRAARASAEDATPDDADADVTTVTRGPADA